VKKKLRGIGEQGGGNFVTPELFKTRGRTDEAEEVEEKKPCLKKTTLITFDSTYEKARREFESKGGLPTEKGPNTS